MLNHPHLSNNLDIRHYTEPYRHIIIDNLFKDNIYNQIIPYFSFLIQNTIPYNQTTRNSSDYEAYIKGLNLQECINGFDFFASQTLKSFVEQTFDLITSPYIAPAIHLHKTPSKNGFVHRDLSICSFATTNADIATPNCIYEDDSQDLQPNTDKLCRSVALLYYFNHPTNLTENDGGGTGIYEDLDGTLSKSILPINNRLFIFEISRKSYHAYIGANFNRSCFISWYHSSPAYMIKKYWNEYCHSINNNELFFDPWGHTSKQGLWNPEYDPMYFHYFDKPLHVLTNSI